MAKAMREPMYQFIVAWQQQLCAAFAALEGSSASYVTSEWQRPEGGGGRSCVFEGGRILERGGVNISQVYGELSYEAVVAMGGGQSVPKDADRTFYATGLSMVLHPKNPLAPIVHANYRYFERGDG